MKRNIWIPIALAVLLAAPSCKKDEETSTNKPSLYGLDFNLPSFGRVGDTFVMTPTGVMTSDGKESGHLTYKWKLSGGEYQETERFTFTAEEDGSYTVTCLVLDDDDNYYSSTASHTIDIIDPTLGNTIANIGITPREDHFVDPRGDREEENTYYYMTAGDLEWMRNNLAWTGAGVPYQMAEVTSYLLGRYYTWDEAMTACPDGWRLPTDEEWAVFGDDAGALMADALFHDKKMWEFWPQVNLTNKSRMSVIPSGYAIIGPTTPSFNRMSEYAAFWTATESEEDAAMARYRYMNAKTPQVMMTYGDKKTLALSVRCVK